MSATGPSLRLAAMASVDDLSPRGAGFLQANPDIATADLFVRRPWCASARAQARAGGRAWPRRSAPACPCRSARPWLWNISGQRRSPPPAYDQESGDGDALCAPCAGHARRPMTWAPRRRRPRSDADHARARRPVLHAAIRAMCSARVIGRLAALGLTLVVATELEFYLVEPTGAAATAAPSRRATPPPAGHQRPLRAQPRRAGGPGAPSSPRSTPLPRRRASSPTP